MKYTAEEVVERFESLPDDLKAAITSEEVDAKIQEIAKKHFLHIDQTAELADETGLVMLGLTKTEEYIGNLRERLGLPGPEVTELAKDIDEMIFRPIKSSLVGMRGGEEGSREPEELLDREQVMRELDEHLQEGEKILVVENKKSEMIDQKQPINTGATPEVPGPTLPTTIPSAPVGIVEKKLTETVKIPKEETVIDRTSNRYGGQDPYREPVE